MFQIYHNKRVLVTGHTGFKGAWLCLWLRKLGAQVYGLALDPPTTPSLYNDLHLAKDMDDVRFDIRDRRSVEKRVAEVKPNIVFHLAAQPLVRESYVKPVETFETNVMGTSYLLDALRLLRHPCAVVVVTTDKVYENKEWIYGYREIDPLGGHDPYSASKACVEILAKSWCKSFGGSGTEIALSTARAGNVIGGGDWAADRIVPDCIRALAASTPIRVRNPNSIRPWQHVLEPLSGYLLLGARLYAEVTGNTEFRAINGEAFNFGPDANSARTVGQLVNEILKHWPGSYDQQEVADSYHEAGLLSLSAGKARALLGWTPSLCFENAVANTIEQYKGLMTAEDFGRQADVKKQAAERAIAEFEREFTVSDLC